MNSIRFHWFKVFGFGLMAEFGMVHVDILGDHFHVHGKIVLGFLLINFDLYL